MTAPTKVFLVDADPRRHAALRYAFGQLLPAGGEFELRSLPAAELPALTADGGVLVVAASARDQLRAYRAAGGGVPALMYAPALATVASEEAAADLLRAAQARALGDGASEVVFAPGYLRDLVLATRLLAGPGERVGQYVGTLGTFAPVLALLRAVSALGRSGVLTLRRGFRAGEVRYCDGEVTAVQVGGHHGQAALHQLLLWSEGRFDFRREDVVRRRQIPLPPEELFADAERFLGGVRDASSGLAPVSLLELDAAVAQANADKIPSEVQGVLRLFDGNRALGDILEDSPYRVFETLRVVARARDLRLLKPAAQPVKAPAWQPRLDLERWLVGAFAAAPEASAAAPAPKGKGARRKTPNPRAAAAAGDIDWGVLAPRVVGAELLGLSGVVPAAAMTGEIIVAGPVAPAPAEAPATRKAEREGLEALTDAAGRDLFAGVAVPRTLTPSAPAPSATASGGGQVTGAVAGEISGEIDAAARSARTRTSSAHPVAASGEIVPRPRPVTAPLSAPAVEPAILVADLAAAHIVADQAADQLPAAPAAAVAVASAPAPVDAPAVVAKIEQARADAAAFSDDEERFFQSGVVKTVPVPKQEVFKDLDSDYQPVGFWDRLRGKKPTNHGE